MIEKNLEDKPKESNESFEDEKSGLDENSKQTIENEEEENTFQEAKKENEEIKKTEQDLEKELAEVKDKMLRVLAES